MWQGKASILTYTKYAVKIRALRIIVLFFKFYAKISLHTNYILLFRERLISEDTQQTLI